MLPTFAVAHGRSLYENNKEVFQKNQEIEECKNKISSASDPIQYHSNILQDTLNKMNAVKWYQFWKWKFFLHDGPEKIKEEANIIDSISKQLNSSSNKIEESANSNIQTGSNLVKENQTANTTNILYNTGEAFANTKIIQERLSENFHSEYIVSKPENLNPGDIVQYPLKHNNYVYLQFIGMNPTGDKALFLGSHNTAIRLSKSDLKMLKFKISPKDSVFKTMIINRNSGNNPINSPIQNSNTSEQITYIANIQKEGLKNYTDSKISEINDLIGIKNDSKNTGSKLMISGGATELASIILSGIVTILITVECGLELTLSVMSIISIICMPVIVVALAIGTAISGTMAALTATDIVIGALSVASVSLGVISAGLLAAGGGVYAIANQALKNLDLNKTDVENENKLIDTDLKTYNEGEINHLPVVKNRSVNSEQNRILKDSLNSSDDDGDGVIYFMVDKPCHGNLTLLKNGSYEYKPAQGYSGNDNFTYMASDIFGNSNTATINIYVHQKNHPPVSADVNLDIEQNNNLSYCLKSTDLDNDPLSYHLLENPSHGNIILNQNGSFSYIPGLDFIGNDTFTYTAQDWKGDGNTAKIHINVHPRNNLPITENSTIKVAKNEKIMFKLNATDYNGDILFYNIVSPPSKGKLTLNLNGTLTYEPNKGIIGSDNFIFTVNDWQGKSNPSKVSIEIYEFNHQPLAENLTIEITKNRPYRGSFNAKDIDHDKLTYQIISNPKKGTLTNLGFGKFIYKPNKDFKGIDKFQYTVSDGKLTSNAIVTIKLVNKPNTGLKNNPIPNDKYDKTPNTHLDTSSIKFSSTPKITPTPTNQRGADPLKNSTLPFQFSNNPLDNITTFFLNLNNFVKTILIKLTNKITFN